MTATHADKFVLARVDYADLFVLAGGGDQTAVIVPGDGVDDVRVELVQHAQLLRRACVPDDDLVIIANRRQDVLCRGMPQDLSYLGEGRDS